jgi:glycosyltransferase involved in cell wall biosynthesis
LWNDHRARDQIAGLVGDRANIRYLAPGAPVSSLGAFGWLMTRLAGVLRREKADLVLGVNHHFPTGGIPQIIYHMNVLRFARPHAGLFRSGEIADRIRDWRARRSLALADANVFESQYLAMLARQKATAIRNERTIYIGLKNGEAERATNAEGSVTPEILAITSTAPHKDNTVLIDMLAELHRRRPDVPWRLRIAGGNGAASFPELLARAVEAGIDGRIDWLGYLDHDSLAAFGAKSLCLVTASRVESFCMVALEAMSWGCPAIVANATAMPESVEDAGLLAEPGDVDGFTRQVLQLWDNRDLRNDLVARGKFLAAKRTWAQAAREFEGLFQKLTAN